MYHLYGYMAREAAGCLCDGAGDAVSHPAQTPTPSTVYLRDAACRRVRDEKRRRPGGTATKAASKEELGSRRQSLRGVVHRRERLEPWAPEGELDHRHKQGP